MNIKLNGELAPTDDVADFKISPDGQWVVFRAGMLNTATGNDPSNESQNLFSVSTHGGMPIRLNALLPAESTVYPDYAISPDSQRVVYRAEQDQPFRPELYSVPIGGPSGSAVKLNPTSDGFVGSFPPPQRPGFRLSPDGSRVVYWGNLDDPSIRELYSVPIEGQAGAGVRLSGDLHEFSDIEYRDYRTSPDGQWVVYVAGQDSAARDLYCVPIDGPSTDAVKLNGLLTPGGDVHSIEISPDSSRVVYVADQQVDEQRELYTVPIRGPAGAGEKLNGLLAGVEDVDRFTISPNSLWVVYGTNQRDGVYRTPIEGMPGGGERISHDLPPDRVIVGPIEFTPDSSRVVYSEWGDNGQTQQIFSTPITGTPGDAVVLNKPLSGLQSVESYQISAPTQRIVYMADQDTSEAIELYSVPWVGPASEGIQINVGLGDQGDVRDFHVSPDGFQVAYLADRMRIIFGNDVFRLWAVPVDGPIADTVLHGSPPVAGGDVTEKFAFTPGGQRVVYIADQDTDDMFELYVSEYRPAAAGKWQEYQ